MARNRRTANGPAGAQVSALGFMATESVKLKGPALRDVLELVRCKVVLSVEDHHPDEGVDVVQMCGWNGPILVTKLERSRVLAGQALLSCRPRSVETSVDAGNGTCVTVTVRPFDGPRERG